MSLAQAHFLGGALKTLHSCVCSLYSIMALGSLDNALTGCGGKCRQIFNVLILLGPEGRLSVVKCRFVETSGKQCNASVLARTAFPSLNSLTLLVKQ